MTTSGRSETALVPTMCRPEGSVVGLQPDPQLTAIRFHAWQSALLFTAVFIIHLIFSWSVFFGWLLFLCDLGLIVFLTLKAYRDADMLDRFEVPFFGQIASRFVDEE